ncbi:MAG: fibronectin type III domain-containing protein [Bacteroidales bacterium]|nr:fibronectin type III domain-containing protein [Bacteroidales bacterium]
MKKFFIFSLLCLVMAFGFVPRAQAQGNCTITTLPFTEDFESVSTGLPPCFTRNLLGLHPLNGSQLPFVGSYQAHTGSHALRGFNNCYPDTSAQVPTLIFPELDSQFSMSNMVLEFWGRSAFYPTIAFVVGVMDDPEDMSTFTAVETFTFLLADEYQKFTAYFSNYSGTGSYIAIKIANTQGVPGAAVYGEGFIDDITLSQAALCSPVQNLAVVSNAGTDVTINWRPNQLGGTSAYTVTLENLTTGQQELFNTTVDTFYTFNNLDFSTDYRAYVAAICLDNQESVADSVDFSTISQAIDFPFFDDFEGDPAIALSPFTFSGTGANQWVYGTAAALPAADAQPGDLAHAIYISPDSGATCTYLANGNISDAYAVFNVIFPSSDLEYHLAFDYKVEGEASAYMEFDYMKVYMLDASATIPATGAPSGVALLHNLEEVANVTDWTHFDMILNNVAGTAKQIVFYWYNNGWNLYGDYHFSAAVDNISVSGLACAQPNNLSASGITQTDATVSWNEVGSATSWVLHYHALGDTMDNEIVVSDTFYTLTGLTTNTEYEYYVVADCGNEQSAPSVTATFRTDCGQISQLPYSEDFETGVYSTTPDAYIACWSRLGSDPEHYAYIGSASYNAHSGDHFMDFHYTPNCYVIAVMPELAANINANELLINFYACHTNYGYATLGTLEVGVMTNKDSASTFVPVDTIDLSAASSYTYVEQMVSTVGYTGNGKYIAFRASNSSGCGFYIDDLVLEQRPACMYPNDFAVVSVGTDSVTLSWTEMGEATMWDILYGPTGFTPSNDDIPTIVNTNPAAIGGLNNHTAYDFYLRSNCGGTQSEWVGPLSVATGVYNMGTLGYDSLITCDAIICDNGGFAGDYATYCDAILVIYPETSGSGLQITGTCDLSLGMYGYGESHIYFHDGVGTSGALIANITGVDSNIAVAASGPITVHFTSGYYTGAGFMLNVSCAACTPPSNLAASNVTNNEITLSWTGNSDQYAVIMTGTSAGYYTTSDSSIVISGLSSNAYYTFQVRSLCGADSSLLCPAITLTTTCDALTITAANPWTEDFESYTGGGNQPFQCWARPVVDNTYSSPFVYCGHAPSCHSGANSAEMKGSDAMLVLPVFSNDVHELRLSFWATSTNPITGTLEVGVMSDFNDPTTFELVGTCGVPGPRGTDTTADGNYMGPFDFANVLATNGRIALRYSNSSSWESWNLDDFTVEIAPLNCVMPTGLTVTNITQTSATATWTAGGDETAWKLQYKAATASDWGSEISVSTPSYDITGLVAETVYQVRVKSDCGNGEESGWTTPYDFFTTPLPVVQPTVVTYAATDITQTSGTMNGTITDEGNQTIVLRGFEYKLPGDNDYTQVVTMTGNTMTYTLAGLAPNTCVNYRAYATTPVGTVYGDTMSFCTLPEDTPEPCDLPTGLDTTVVLNETIGITWDMAEVYDWNLRYRPQNGEWTTVTATSNTYPITGLTANTTYEIQVQANCGGGNFSDWSGSLFVTTTNVGIESWLAGSVALYPNPAKEYVDVRIDGDVNVTAMEVYDVYGKLVNNVVVVDNPTRINVSSLADGMYFVRVTTGEGMVTKTFVKR